MSGFDNEKLDEEFFAAGETFAALLGAGSHGPAPGSRGQSGRCGARLQTLLTMTGGLASNENLLLTCGVSSRCSFEHNG